MNFYDIIMNPLELFFLNKIRKKLIKKASGNVLEIGVGTGVNHKYYDALKVRKITAIDLKLAPEIKMNGNIKYELLEENIEKLSFKDNSFDTVVVTLVLCSVDNLNNALDEIKRVLKPNGKYIFIEHVMPENNKLALFFDKLNFVWCKVAHGCNLNRKTCSIIDKKGFRLLKARKMFAGIFCYGIAKKPNNKIISC